MLRFGLALIVLAGCVTGPADRPVQADPRRAGGRLRAVVAAHEGVGQDEVQVSWEQRTTPEGTDVFAVRSPQSLHICEVDARSRGASDSYTPRSDPVPDGGESTGRAPILFGSVGLR